MRVFVTGGTGFIGGALVEGLLTRGDEVVVLTRSRAGATSRLPAGETLTIVEGDPQYRGEWTKALAGCDAIVHLAGAPVAGKRWNAQVRQLIMDSRVAPLGVIGQVVRELSDGERPRVLITASGVDYYPFAEDIADATMNFADDPVDERCPPGDTFLAKVCVAWEREAEWAGEGMRVAFMRTGLVLGKGPLLDRLTGPFKFFLGGPLGTGRQWTSWIHLDDAVGGYLHVLDQDVAGPVNLVAPHNATQKQLAVAVGRAMGRPAWAKVPSFALRVALGEFADHVLHGRRVVPSVLEASGYVFRYPDLEQAVTDLFP